MSQMREDHNHFWLFLYARVVSTEFNINIISSDLKQRHNPSGGQRSTQPTRGGEGATKIGLVGSIIRPRSVGLQTKLFKMTKTGEEGIQQEMNCSFPSSYFLFFFKIIKFSIKSSTCFSLFHLQRTSLEPPCAL